MANHGFRPRLDGDGIASLLDSLTSNASHRLSRPARVDDRTFFNYRWTHATLRLILARTRQFDRFA